MAYWQIQRSIVVPVDSQIVVVKGAQFRTWAVYTGAVYASIDALAAGWEARLAGVAWAGGAVPTVEVYREEFSTRLMVHFSDGGAFTVYWNTIGTLYTYIGGIAGAQVSSSGRVIGAPIPGCMSVDEDKTFGGALAQSRTHTRRRGQFHALSGRSETTGRADTGVEPVELEFRAWARFSASDGIGLLASALETTFDTILGDTTCQGFFEVATSETSVLGLSRPTLRRWRVRFIDDRITITPTRETKSRHGGFVTATFALPTLNVESEA
jgi:hypothetical protein